MRAIRLVSATLAFLASFFVLAVPQAPAQKAEPQRPAVPKGFVANYDVPYVSNGDPAQVLDIFIPEKRAEKPQPLLVWIHGGGWIGGSKTPAAYLHQLPRGYVVASIEYRFSDKAIFPAQIQDCQAAIRWLRAHAKKYNIDPDHVGVGGASAGGHLVALLGTSGGKTAFPPIGGNEDQSDRVQAVCDIFGPTDFWTVIKQAEEDRNVKNAFKWNNGDPYSKLIGAKLGEDKERCDAVSPVHYVSKDCPPFLILHGDRDTLVPYAQSVELADLLTKADVKVTLQRLPGAGHGGPAFGLPAVTRLTNAFFDKYLKGAEATIEALPAEQVTINPAVQRLNRDIPRHKDFLKRIEQSKGVGDVIFLGDSITHGWEGQKAWQEHFGAFKPVNLGIGGDQTGHVLWRITEGHELDHLNPKAAVIMIGTNNISSHTAQQIAGGIKAIVEELKHQKPDIKVLVLGVFPRGSSADAERSLDQISKSIKPIDEELKKEKPDIKRLNALVRNLEQQRGTIPAAKLNKKVAQINAIIANLDDGRSVFYKDIGKEFLDQNGGLSGEIMPDYLHLSAKGYDIWGKAIKGDIEKLVQ